MADTGILDIDSEEDYELMQVIAKYLFENNEDYKETFEKAKSWR
jgi:CMP-N,N'-diacetyllegionaminic acid synthase